MQTLIKVRSEYVVQYMDAWVEKDMAYIKMELCSHSLKHFIIKKQNTFKRQSAEAMSLTEFFISCEIFREILESVEYLHEMNPQIIHRDLKPDNILLTHTVTNGRFFKLCDFGLAILHEGTGSQHTGGVGTLRYMAPEVKLNAKYTTKADVYSLAVIAYELFDLKTYE